MNLLDTTTKRKEIDLSVETDSNHDVQKLVVVTPASGKAIVVSTIATSTPLVVVKLKKEASSRKVYYYDSDDGDDDDIVHLGSNAGLPDTQHLKAGMARAMAGDSEETTLDVDDDNDRNQPPLRPPILNWAKYLKNKNDFKEEGESTGESGSEEYF